MTIEDIIRAVEDQTGEKVTADTLLSDIVKDSLDFLDLILQISTQFGHIPDSKVAQLNTVNDLYLVELDYLSA